MHRAFLTTTALVATAAMAAAQTPTFIGFNYNAQVGATSRGSLGAAAGEIMTVIKGEEYAGWGTELPGSRTIRSVACVVQDQNGATPETFDIKIYPEDVASPGRPDIAAGVVFATGVAGPGPATPGPVAAAVRTVTPATPAVVPIQGTGDIFVSFVLPAQTSSTDGLSIQIVLGYQPTAAFTIFDIPGPDQQPVAPLTVNNTHALTYNPATAAITLNQRHNHYIDVAHLGAGGVATGITNQTSMPGSNNPPPAGYGPCPGVADFMSGVSPDVVGFNAGRADDIAFDYFRGTAAANNLVLFFADIGTFGPEVPLGLIFPGGTGTVCVNPTFFQLGSALADANGEAFLVTTFPAAVRPLAAGLQVIQQALEVDVLGNAFHLSPCGRQTL